MDLKKIGKSAKDIAITVLVTTIFSMLKTEVMNKIKKVV